MLSLSGLRVHRLNPAFGIKGKCNFLNTDSSNVRYLFFRVKFLKHSGNYMHHQIYYLKKTWVYYPQVHYAICMDISPVSNKWFGICNGYAVFSERPEHNFIFLK